MHIKPADINRTLRLTEDDIKKYSSRPITLSKAKGVRPIINRIINQDIFTAIKYLPENFVDMMFIDPPYNMTKKFNLVAFKRMKHSEYEGWLDSWLSEPFVILGPGPLVGHGSKIHSAFALLWRV